jgi:hypothetical protein
MHPFADTSRGDVIALPSGRKVTVAYIVFYSDRSTRITAEGWFHYFSADGAYWTTAPEVAA